MKVLVITSTLEEKSGWGRYSHAVVLELIKTGVEVKVFSEERPLGLDCAWQKLRPIGKGKGVLAFLQNVFAVRKAAKSYEIVHALDGWPFGVYGLFAAIGRKNRLFINGVGTYSVTPLYSRLRAPLLRAAYKRAQKIFCISSYTREQIANAGVEASKLEVVHLGATKLPALAPSEEASYSSIYPQLSSAHPIVLTVGAIKDRKGQFDTLRAIEILKKSHPSILYVVAGRVEQPSYHEKMLTYAREHNLEKNLLVVSDAQDSLLSFLYSKSTVFALNSNNDAHSHHFEGFGLVVLEANQFGKPAVGSKNSGIADAIVDGSTGLLTEEKDPADIAQKTELILAQYDLYAQNATMRYANFSWQKTVGEYIRFYKDSDAV